mmetsp:Transcript_29817/g.53979  ORF Transcript_29817/g.53979 Transcript_29817/m.53979 type:complete len:423 (+) Transcript_29817:575-1843(+)
MGQALVEPGQAAERAVVFGQCREQLRVHREVHHARCAGRVAVMVALAALPVGHDGRMRAPLLADDVQLRVLQHHAGRPAAQEVAVRVGPGVGADARQPGALDPPQGHLRQIGGEFWPALVQVRHARREPAVGEALAVAWRRIGVLQRHPRMVGFDIALWPLVQPVGCRQIAQPPVPGADVVEHDVLDHADLAFARCADEVEVVLVAAETRVDLVEVGRGVAVVAVGRAVVFDQRRRPHLGEAQVGDVAQMPAQAGEVAAMAAAGVGAIRRLLHAALAAAAALGEAVGHDEVDRILGAEAAALGRAGGTRTQRIAQRVARQVQRQLARRGPGADVEVDEQIVRAARAVAAAQRDAGIGLQRRLGGGDPGTMQHQLQRGVAHAHPPVGRLDARQWGSLGEGDGGRGHQQGRGKGDQGIHFVSSR